MRAAAAFIMLTGLLVTVGGVGGIEHNDEILTPLIVTAVGLLVMWAGSIMIRRESAE